MDNALHVKMCTILEKSMFEKLLVKRIGHECYLILMFDGKSEVFVGKDGTQRKYRHVWQVTEWLKKSYGIDKEKIEIITHKY